MFSLDPNPHLLLLVSNGHLNAQQVPGVRPAVESGHHLLVCPALVKKVNGEVLALFAQTAIFVLGGEKRKIGLCFTGCETRVDQN